MRLSEKLFQLQEYELPQEVQCGTGRRQYQVAQALGLHYDKDRLHFSGLWGDASTLVKVSGEKKVLLSHGLVIDYEQYDTANHVGGETIRRGIANLPNNSVICSGRPVLIRLGMKPEEGKNGALYALDVDDNVNITTRLVVDGVTLES